VKVEFVKPVIEELEAIDRILRKYWQIMLTLFSLQIMDKAKLRQHHYPFIMGIDSDPLLHKLIAKDVETGKTVMHIETG
jgi:hypothetical protein